MRRRRAGLLLGLTLVVPGAGQYAHGSRALGRFGIRVWLSVVFVALLALVAALVFPGPFVGFLGRGLVLKAIAVLVAVVAALDLVFLVNTWWIARPRQLGGLRAVLFTLVTAALGGVLVFASLHAVRALDALGTASETLFTGGGDPQPKEGRYNILLLGADSGPDRDGLRPDSITLASVDAGTGRTVLFSLPRNLENALFASGTPLAGLFPYGYNSCGEDNCMLNSIYLLGQQHADLFPGVADPGVQAMIDAVSGTLGLEVNYYAMVNMAGFASLIDAVGGIDLTLREATQIGIIDDWQTEHVLATVGPGLTHMNGETALLYARSRIQGTNSMPGNDFVRMGRQKCVMSAMLAQLSPANVAMNFANLADASGNVLVSSVPTGEIAELGGLALKARELPIVSVSFTPPLISTGDPDFALIHQTVQQRIAEAEAADQPATEPATTDPGTTDPATTDPGTSVDTPPVDTADPPTDVADLQAECAA